jgi:hypothetical protein
MDTHPLVVGSLAPQPVSSLSSSQFCEEDRRERKVQVFKNQCALPQEQKRAEEKRRIMVKVVCPECRGAKSSYTVSCGDRGCGTGMRTCEFCKGEGQVSTEAAERWVAKIMRRAAKGQWN